MHLCCSVMTRWLTVEEPVMADSPPAFAHSPMSQRSSEVQAGRMTSANWASPSIQMDWLTTHSMLSCR